MTTLTPDIQATEFGEMGYLVIDVEAILLGPQRCVVEQLGLALRSCDTGNLILAERFTIYQPNNINTIARLYGVPRDLVAKSVAAYKMVTGDNYVHDDCENHFRWSKVKGHVLHMIKNRVIKTYAKGAALERMVMGNSVIIDDLEWFNCPKYPLAIHDPMEECIFFADFIPELLPPPPKDDEEDDQSQ